MRSMRSLVFTTQFHLDSASLSEPFWKCKRGRKQFLTTATVSCAFKVCFCHLHAVSQLLEASRARPLQREQGVNRVPVKMARNVPGKKIYARIIVEQSSPNLLIISAEICTHLTHLNTFTSSSLSQLFYGRCCTCQLHHTLSFRGKSFLAAGTPTSQNSWNKIIGQVVLFAMGCN